LEEKLEKLSAVGEAPQGQRIFSVWACACNTNQPAAPGKIRTARTQARPMVENAAILSKFAEKRDSLWHCPSNYA
jgi:hypothetical protein